MLFRSKSADKASTSPDYLPHSRRGTIWRRAPLPAPLLSTSTPNSLRQLYTSSEDSIEEWNVLCCVLCMVCGVWCVSSFGPPPLVFIGGNHQPFAREMSQTAIGDQPHLATCYLRGGGARGLSPLGRPTLLVGQPWAGSVRPGLWSEDF